MLLSLIQHIALLAMLAVSLQMLSYKLKDRSYKLRIVEGLLFGLTCIVGMMSPVQFAPGIFYDGRSLVLSLAGFFSGPVPALIAAGISSIYRLLLGGTGAWVGIGVIVEAAGLGIALHYLSKHNPKWLNPVRLLLFGFLVHGLMLIIQLFLPGGAGWVVWQRFGLVIFIGYSLAFLLTAQIFIEMEQRRQAVQNLSENESYLRAVIRAAADGFVIVDFNGRILDVNDAYCSMSGYSRAELLLRSVADLDTETSPQDVQEQNRQIQKKGAAWFEARHRRKDGTIIPVDVSVTYFPERGGQYIAFCRDLSDRHRSREQLTLLGRLLDAAPVAVMIHNRDGRIFFVNQTAVVMHGYDNKEELLALNLGELDVPAPDSELEDSVRRFEAYGEASFEVVHHRKDGSQFPMAIQIKKAEWEGGPVILSIGSDITERKQTEEKLAHSHYLMRYVIEHSNSAVAIHDRDLRYIYVSQQYLNDFEVGDQNIIGKHPYEMFTEIPTNWRIAHQKALQGESSRSEADTFRRKDGTVHYTRWECRPWYDVDGSIGGIIIYAEDITAGKNLEEQLRQSQKMESIGRLAGGIAHDFNNMLGVILGHAELILDDLQETSPLRTDIEEIRKAAQRSANLTRQLLAFARRQTITPKKLDLNETVESMLKMLRRLIGEDVDLLWDPASHPAHVAIDPIQIDQVLANLVVNSRDAIRHSVGRIVIHTELIRFDEEYCRSHSGYIPGNYVLLSVSDNGCGMDASVKEKVFEPFFTTKPVGEGTGLGLATVYGIVKQNNGFIDLESEPGKGTIVRIYLPIQSADSAADAGINEEIPSVNRGETILLVEDEPALLELTGKMLRHLGYTALYAHTPEDAMRIAEQHPEKIHLLITDVVMPRMNGWDLSRLLSSCLPDIKCLYMSGYADDVLSPRGAAGEAFAFIQKPFSVYDLGNKIRTVLDRD